MLGRAPNRSTRARSPQRGAGVAAPARTTPRSKTKFVLGSVNINGAGSEETHHKWSDLISTMRTNRIGIMVVQETHLTHARTSRLRTTYNKNVILHNSSEIFNENSKGVAVLINRLEVKCTKDDIDTYEIVAGRAIMVSVPWRTPTGKLHILGVYAPNDPEQNEVFWNQILAAFAAHPAWPAPDFMAGDLNMVENPRDREPPSACRAATAAALRTLLDRYHLVDGWRKENPGMTRYTWRSRATTGPHVGNRSRIDRIYIRDALWDDSRDWGIQVDHPISTDHELIQASLYDIEAPYIGKGRWEVPSFLLKHDKFLEVLDDICSSAVTDAKSHNDAGRAQTILEELKTRIRDRARSIAKESVPKTRKKINELKKKLEEEFDDEALTPEERNERTDALSEEIKQLEHAQLDKRRADTATKWMLESETIGRTWIRAN
ncbi:Endonuclease/exonuclease/phosphatase, partial [Ephemerocybe angulata]